LNHTSENKFSKLHISLITYPTSFRVSTSLK